VPSSAPDPVTAFFDALADAPERVLLLDYDGTLAPFRAERDAATPYEGVREAIQALRASGRTRLVVVSGRSIDRLRPLLGVEPPPELWGTHGWEHLEPGRPVEARPLPPAAAAALGEAARGPAGAELGDRVEVKPASVAVHTRGLAPPDTARMLAAVRATWEPLASKAGLELHAFDGGLELRVQGWNKGDAVRAVLAGVPPGAAVAYLGDDVTDEDAFRALDEMAREGQIEGLTVLVRPVRRVSAARVWLEPPDGLMDFLGRWRAAGG